MLYLGTVEQNEPITKLEIPEGTERVEAWAFEYLTSLTSVSIPSSVKILGGGTFYGCTNIEEIVLPEGLEQFGYKEFAGCTKLAKLTIPSTVIKIDQDAFVDVSALENIWCKAYPNKLYWRDYTFNTFMPEKATKFHVVNQTAWEEKYPEAKCTFVGDIEVGTTAVTYHANEKLAALDDYTKFDGAYALVSHEFAGGTGTATYSGEIDGVGANAFRNIEGLTSIVIPEGTTTLEDYAFEGCTSLTRMVIPSSVTNIGNYTFRGCSNLTVLTIDEPVANSDASRRVQANLGLQQIGNGAFESCPLTAFTIPATVTTIGDDAFYDCNSLIAVVAKWSTPITIANATFTNRANASLYVPNGAKEAYEAAEYWKEFKEIVQYQPDYKLGDANNDQSVNVTDIVATVNYIMENPTGSFDKLAADVNKDGYVNVTDIVGMVNIIMSSGSRMDQQEVMAILKEYDFIFKGER
jgi:hypothetical protein